MKYLRNCAKNKDVFCVILVTLLDGANIWMDDHLDKIPSAVLLGKSGWRSGHQSCLPLLLQMWYVD